MAKTAEVDITYENGQELTEIPVPGKLKDLQSEMQFHALLRSNPAKLAKKHPQINAQYLPIGVVEQMLDAIFPGWSWERTNSCIMANSIVYEGVLTVKNPHNDKVARPIVTGKQLRWADTER